MRHSLSERSETHFRVILTPKVWYTQVDPKKNKKTEEFERESCTHNPMLAQRSPSLAIVF